MVNLQVKWPLVSLSLNKVGLRGLFSQLSLDTGYDGTLKRHSPAPFESVCFQFCV